jgi:ABC-type Co2+ transport system permease subunit
VWYVDAIQLIGYGYTIMLDNCVTILVIGPVLGWLLSIRYRKSAPFLSEWERMWSERSKTRTILEVSLVPKPTAE